MMNDNDKKIFQFVALVIFVSILPSAMLAVVYREIFINEMYTFLTLVSLFSVNGIVAGFVAVTR